MEPKPRADLAKWHSADLPNAGAFSMTNPMTQKRQQLLRDSRAQFAEIREALASARATRQQALALAKAERQQKIDQALTLDRFAGVYFKPSAGNNWCYSLPDGLAEEIREHRRQGEALQIAIVNLAANKRRLIDQIRDLSNGDRLLRDMLTTQLDQ